MPSIADRKDSPVEAEAQPHLPRTAVCARARLINSSQAETTHNVDRRSRFALVPSRVWARLALPSQADKVAVAVEFPPPCNPSFRASANIRSVSCLYVATQQPAERDDSAAQYGEGEDLILLSHAPEGLPHTSPLWRSEASATTSVPVRIAVRRLVTLAHVILATDDHNLLDAASDPSSSFNADLDGALMRQGDQVQLSCGAAKVIQTDPVLQGAVSAHTSVLVAHDPDAFAAASQDRGQAQPSAADIASGEAGDSFTIDERFLASSVIEAFEPNSDDEADFGTTSAPVLPVNGDSTISHKQTAYLSSSHMPEFEIRAIQEQKALLHAIQSWRGQHALAGQDGPPSEVDEEGALLLEDRGLAAIGAFNGDWAVAELSGQRRRRLVRIFSLADCSGSQRTCLPAWLPPGLVQNLCDDPSHFDPQASPAPTLRLAPISSSPRGVPAAPLACPLPMPFADSLTIARVPSAISINRQYQSLFLDALRTYFEGRKRIVQQGDILAVGVDKSRVRWIGTKAADGGAEDKRQGAGSDGDDKSAKTASGDLKDVEAVDYDLPASVQHDDGDQSEAQKTVNGVVYFRITDLSPELTDVAAAGSTAERNASERDVDFELRETTRLGHLGAVVEPTLTKMVQTGVAASRVADCEGWLGVDSGTPAWPANPSSPLTMSPSPFGQITELIQATLLPRAANYGLHLSVLLKGARGSGKKTLVRWAAKKMGIHLIEFNCFDLLGDTETQTEGVLRARFESASSCGPALVLLRNIDALARKSQATETGQEPAMSHVLRSCLEGLRSKAGAEQGHRPVAVFGTTSDADRCPNGIIACFKHEISIEAPNEAERLEILKTAVGSHGADLAPDVSLKDVATQTAALVAADLADLVTRAKMASVDRVRKAIPSSVAAEDVQAAGIALTGADFEHALGKARFNYSESIGAPKIPNVTWDDVGGLASVKDDILDTIQLPLEHPELFANGLKKRSGILLYGPPGTGKTLLAKAVATSCSLNFFSVKGPELLNMYIGESEANVRRVFQRARDAKPCVIFFDELDSVAPKRGNQGDSGGVMDRIVSQLLAELDGMAGSKEGTDVFVIGATNRPDLLDPALLRPGRFDRMLYLSVCETHAAQLGILRALTRKFKLEEDADSDTDLLTSIAEQCPFNLTGADFYALCSDAMLKAMTRKASAVDRKIEAWNERYRPGAGAAEDDEGARHPYPMTAQYYLSELAEPSEIEVRVGRSDFEEALRELVPSVSEAEMEHYRRVQGMFSGQAAGKSGDSAGTSGEPAAAQTVEEQIARALDLNGGTAAFDLGQSSERADGQEAGLVVGNLEAPRPGADAESPAVTTDGLEAAEVTDGTGGSGGGGSASASGGAGGAGGDSGGGGSGKGKGKRKDKGKGKARE